MTILNKVHGKLVLPRYSNKAKGNWTGQKKKKKVGHYCGDLVKNPSLATGSFNDPGQVVSCPVLQFFLSVKSAQQC